MTKKSSLAMILFVGTTVILCQVTGLKAEAKGVSTPHTVILTQNPVPNPYIDAVGFVPVPNHSSTNSDHHGPEQLDATNRAEHPDDRSLVHHNRCGHDSSPRSTLVLQSAEQMDSSPQTDVNSITVAASGSINDAYMRCAWVNEDIVGDLFKQIGELLPKWIIEILGRCIADPLQALSTVLVRVASSSCLIAGFFDPFHCGVKALSVIVMLLYGSLKGTNFDTFRRRLVETLSVDWVLADVLLAIEFGVSVQLVRESAEFVGCAFGSCYRGTLLGWVGSLIRGDFGTLGSWPMGQVLAFTALIMIVVLGMFFCIQIARLIMMRFYYVAIVESAPLWIASSLSLPKRSRTTARARLKNYAFASSMSCGVLLLLKLMIATAVHQVGEWNPIAILLCCFLLTVVAARVSEQQISVLSHAVFGVPSTCTNGNTKD